MFEKGAELLDRMAAASRAENQAAGQRLAAIGELDVLRLREVGERETWMTDTQEEISAEVAAALGITPALATSYLYYARVMRSRLPRVGALLCAGDITYWMFQTMVYRTDLITDPEVLAGVDAVLAARVSRWPGLSQSRLAAYVDRIVARADRDAVRQRREAQAHREFDICDGGNGLSEVFGRLFTTDAHAVDARLDALANTVCAHDPRTRNQRRADAMGALAAGAERLQCRCGLPDCPAGAGPGPGPVVVHVIAEQATLEGSGTEPGVMIGVDELIPAELIAELAESAKLRPVVHPADAPAEPGYTPSRALADFIRCRDLTCRFPGCDRPASATDIDHTIPYGQGGPTHASNLKCLCRRHHLVKTFWGWRDKQLPDGTIVWSAPAGQTYVTTPGSALLFPTLCVPTGELPQPKSTRTDRCGDRGVMMPKRQRTRAQNRAAYISAERKRNRETGQARQAARLGPAPPSSDQDEPPPF